LNYSRTNPCGKAEAIISDGVNSQPEGCGYSFWESVDFSKFVKPWFAALGSVIAIVMLG
jgi:hypothetical protein